MNKSQMSFANMESHDIHLKNAVESNDHQRVRELLSQNADPNCFCEKSPAITDKLRPLTLAIQNGSEDIVRLLLEHGAEVNFQEENGNSPLRQTCFYADSDVSGNIAITLIRYGADINQRFLNGQTDIMLLISQGVIPYVDLLPIVDTIENIHETDFLTGETFLHHVNVREDDDHKVALLEKFIMAGISVNSVDDEGDTPLHSMSSIACIESISFLVKNGADIHSKNNKGETALHYLAESSNNHCFFDCLKFFIERGCDLNALDGKGRTLLHHVVCSDDVTKDVINELIECGMASNIQDIEGLNEIYCAVTKVHRNLSEDETVRLSKLIQALADHGVDVNGANFNGMTPLHLATNKQNPAIIKTLLELGADVTKRTKCGISPLHLAALKFDIAPLLIDWCLKQGYSLNDKDVYGSSPLHYAVWFREQIVIKCLLQNGADATSKDKFGETPADLAKLIHYEDYTTLQRSFNDLNRVDTGEAEKLVLEFHASDPFEECPFMEYIDVEDGHLAIDKWTEHKAMHDQSIKKFVQTILLSENMGMYYELEENHVVASLIENVMFTLANRLYQRNPVLKCDVWLAGSNFEGTKIGVPDEFDYIWCLSEFNHRFKPVELPSCPNGFVKLRLIDNSSVSAFAEFTDSNGFLDGRKVNCTLYTLLNEEILKLFKEGTMSESLMLAERLDNTFGSLSNFEFNFCGQRAKCFPISVDIVPTISPPNWKPSEFTLQESRILRNIENKPAFTIVLKTPDRNFVTKPTFYFRKSFASWEQAAIRSFPFYIRKGYIIVKALADSFYFPNIVVNGDVDEMKYVTSYKLKMCFLHELEKAFCDDEDMSLSLEEADITSRSQESLDWARRIVTKFEECIDSGNLPSFFDPTKNLLLMDGMTEMFNVDFYKGSVMCLKLLLDSLN